MSRGLGLLLVVRLLLRGWRVPFLTPVLPVSVGLASTGLDSTGLDSTGLDSTGLASTGLDSTGLDSRGLDSAILLFCDLGASLLGERLLDLRRLLGRDGCSASFCLV